MAKEKHRMDLQDLARILQAATDKVQGQPKTGLAAKYQQQKAAPWSPTHIETKDPYWQQAVDTTQSLVGGMAQQDPGRLGSRPWRGHRVGPDARNILDAMFTDREIDYIPSARDDFRGMIPTEGGWHEATGEGGGFMPDDLSVDFPEDRGWERYSDPSPASSYLDAVEASDNWQSEGFLRRQAEARAATAPGQLEEMFDDIYGSPETRGERAQRLPGRIKIGEQAGYMQAGDEAQAAIEAQRLVTGPGGIDRIPSAEDDRFAAIQSDTWHDSGIVGLAEAQERGLGVLGRGQKAFEREQEQAAQQQAAATSKKQKEQQSARYQFIEERYSNLGTLINNATDPNKRTQLIHERNQLIEEGMKLASALDKLKVIQEGKFPKVEAVRSGDLAKAVSEQQQKKLEDKLSKGMGKGMGALGLKRGELFKGTGYATTGAINGVMRALAGIFILFVFIGVFYMVFGPIYDSLIFNFTNIVSADGDPTLGGKDIPTLFDNVAKVILVWVPLIVFAGALYKLTALVFEREGGSRSTEETEWDMLGSIEDSTDLDAGSDPGVFEAYGGGY